MSGAGWLRDYDQVGEGMRGWCVYPNNVRGAGTAAIVITAVPS